MTNKRVIIVLSVLGLIAILLLVSSLVFKIKTIDVVFATEQTKIEKQEVVETSGIKMGGSIFFVNKNKASANIEKGLPYAKVETIESSFPNKITIKVSTREAQFVIKRETEAQVDYLVCDADLKVLAVETDEAKITDLCLLKVDAGEYSAGDFVNNQIASEISYYLSINGFKAEKVKKYFTSIEFNGTSLIFNNCYNKKIEIKEYSTKLREKINTAISIFTNCDFSKVDLSQVSYEVGDNGELIVDFSVFESNGKIVASF